jgi:hypothetical protein
MPQPPTAKPSRVFFDGEIIEGLLLACDLTVSAELGVLVIVNLNIDGGISLLSEFPSMIAYELEPFIIGAWEVQGSLTAKGIILRRRYDGNRNDSHDNP